MRSLFKKLDQYVFGYGSPTTMAVYRWIIGGLSLVNWLIISPFFDDWFSEKGFVPMSLTKVWQGDSFRWDPLMWIGNDQVNLAAWILLGLVSLTTMVGFKTRISSILLFLLWTAFHHRNPIILHSGDTLLRMSCFALMVAPSGATLSVDRWLSKEKLIEQVSLWPQRLVQLQMAIMYGTTVIHKSYGDKWFNGTAAWYPTRLSEFERFPVPGFLDSPFFVAVATYGTLAVEIGLATLVFDKRFRKWVLLGGLALHGFIEYRMNIPLFAFISCAQYVSHYRGEEVEQWWARLRAKWMKPKAVVVGGENAVAR